MTIKFNGITFGKKGLRDAAGNYYPVSYSRHGRISTGSECLTIYARKHSPGLPASLNALNNSDLQTDYFEKDRVYFNVGTPEFTLLSQFAN